MTKILYSLCFLTLLAGFGCKTSKPTDKVAKANAVNKKKVEEKLVRNDVAALLVKLTDGRLMDSKEGVQALEKGTTSEIRTYGELMIHDQSILLTKIIKLAADRNITLPSGISDSKKEGLKELQEKKGKELDRKFAKMIKIDHERDIKYLKEALKFNDKGIQTFAQENLPLIESHLSKIKLIARHI